MSSFSVVTPNFNMVRYLPETIESVLANLQCGDEYWIIDGGSTDGSVDVIRQYAPRVTGWLSEPDRGYADALVKGFRRCTGEFLCWINSGDLLLRGALSAARQALRETGADLIFGDDLSIDETGRVLGHSHGAVHSLQNMMLYGGWTPLQDACYWRRALYERIGGINPDLIFAGDYDFFLSASLAGRYVYVPKIFSAFRRHANQTSISNRAAYEIERQTCRQHALARLGVPVWRRSVLEAGYWLAVRWRHHIARRFHRPCVAIGAAVNDLMVR